jgi:hypothetical protein
VKPLTQMLLHRLIELARHSGQVTTAIKCGPSWAIRLLIQLSYLPSSWASGDGQLIKTLQARPLPLHCNGQFFATSAARGADEDAVTVSTCLLNHFQCFSSPSVFVFSISYV